MVYSFRQDNNDTLPKNINILPKTIKKVKKKEVFISLKYLLRIWRTSTITLSEYSSYTEYITETSANDELPARKDYSSKNVCKSPP